jgi:hypothetical protein
MHKAGVPILVGSDLVGLEGALLGEREAASLLALERWFTQR